MEINDALATFIFLSAVTVLWTQLLQTLFKGFKLFLRYVFLKYDLLDLEQTEHELRSLTLPGGNNTYWFGIVQQIQGDVKTCFFQRRTSLSLIQITNFIYDLYNVQLPVTEINSYNGQSMSIRLTCTATVTIFENPKIKPRLFVNSWLKFLLNEKK
jgi:hypothetical protein